MSLSFFCMKSYVAVATRLILLEFIQWKSTQIADIYILKENRISKKAKGAMSLSFLVLFVSLSNFSSAFYSLVVD